MAQVAMATKGRRAGWESNRHDARSFISASSARFEPRTACQPVGL